VSGRRAREQRKTAPASARRAPPRGAKPTPVGLVSQYLTAGDLYREPASLERVVEALMTVPVELAVAWVAAMLAPSAWGATMRAHQAEQAREWFDAATPGGRKARDLVLTGERLLLAPQVLLLMARLACIYGAPVPTAAGPGAENALREGMLVLAHHLGADRREADSAAAVGGTVLVGDQDVTAFEVGLVANQLLNRTPFPMSVFDRFERRWREIPSEQAADPQVVDLAAEYETATGVPLADLALVAVALWSRTVTEAGPIAPPGYLDRLGLSPGRAEAVLSLISDTPDGIASRSLAAAESDLDPEYDTGLFGQTPVIRLASGGLVVVSPVLLLERAFGWLPAYDIRHAFEQTGREGRKRADKALACLRRTTEMHAVESLAAAAAAAAGAPGRTFGEDRIQAAYGTARPNADAACAWPGHWVVAEVSSRQTPRTVAGAASARDLLDHLDKGAVAKARQIDATIAAIRADETALTGRPAPSGPRRFWPILIVPDGFPANPLTVRRLRRMIRQAGLLTAPDTDGIIVLDAETLEAVETVAADGGPSLPALLAEHARSDRADYGFKDWLLLERGTLRPTRRITDRWARSFASAFDKLGQNPDPPLEAPPEEERSRGRAGHDPGAAEQRRHRRSVRADVEAVPAVESAKPLDVQTGRGVPEPPPDPSLPQPRLDR
jgi:hypothetical protein